MLEGHGVQRNHDDTGYGRIPGDGLGRGPLRAQQQDDGGYEQQQRDNAHLAQQGQVQAVGAERSTVVSEGGAVHGCQRPKAMTKEGRLHGLLETQLPKQQSIRSPLPRQISGGADGTSVEVVASDANACSRCVGDRSDAFSNGCRSTLPSTATTSPRRSAQFLRQAQPRLLQAGRGQQLEHPREPRTVAVRGTLQFAASKHMRRHEDYECACEAWLREFVALERHDWPGLSAVGKVVAEPRLADGSESVDGPLLPAQRAAGGRALRADRPRPVGDRKRRCSHRTPALGDGALRGRRHQRDVLASVTWRESVTVEKPTRLRRRLAEMCASLAAHHSTVCER